MEGELLSNPTGQPLSSKTRLGQAGPPGQLGTEGNARAEAEAEGRTGVVGMQLSRNQGTCWRERLCSAVRWGRRMELEEVVSRSCTERAGNTLGSHSVEGWLDSGACKPVRPCWRPRGGSSASLQGN